MIQTISATIDASLATIIERRIALTGGLTADQLSAFVTVISTDNRVRNDAFDLTVELDGSAEDDRLQSVIRLENQNNAYGSSHPDEDIRNIFKGGSGDDTIDGTVFVGTEWGTITQRAEGGAGNDTIRLKNQYLDFDSEWGNLVASEALGGDGDDVIEVTSILAQVAGGSIFDHDVTHVIRGGAGKDTISSLIELYQNSGANPKVEIFGDGGNDVITSKLLLNEGGFESVNSIHGGSGSDKIVAELLPVGFTESIEIVTNLFGDGGKDDITSKISLDEDQIYTLVSYVTLTGGGGADVLRSLGGGAFNHNLFDGGSGNDKMYADGSVDEFLFRPAVNQGSDQIFNWDGSMDLLTFEGVALSQIDAQSSIASVGADVVLTLDSGTIITFKGVNIAGADSIYDLFWTGV